MPRKIPPEAEHEILERLASQIHIHVRRTGTPSLAVNGKALEGNLVPLFPDAREVDVQVTL